VEDPWGGLALVPAGDEFNDPLSRSVVYSLRPWIDLNPLSSLTRLRFLRMDNICASECQQPKWTKSNTVKITLLAPNISTTTNISDMGISAISNLINMRNLFLRNVPADSIGFIRTLKNLNILDLSYNTKLKDVKPITVLTNLKELYMDYMGPITLDNLVGTNLSDLHILSLEGTPVSQISSSIFPKLRNLNLDSGYCGLGPCPLPEISISSIKNMLSLGQLTISGRYVTAGDCQELKNALIHAAVHCTADRRVK